MKVLKKLIENDYVELTNQQRKRILGGYDEYNSKKCADSHPNCDGTCDPIYKPGSLNPVKAKCKAETFQGFSYCVCKEA